MTQEEYETYLDTVDKLSLKKEFKTAFEYIEYEVNNLFYPEEYDNLKELVKINALKYGIIIA